MLSKLFIFCLILAIFNANRVFSGPVEGSLVRNGDINFYLWTNSNPIEGQHLVPTVESIENSNFIVGGPVKVVTHGFMTGCDTTIIVSMKDHVDEYLTMGDDVNVICVDWQPLAYHWSFAAFYPTAVENTKIVGQTSAQFLDFLLSEGFTTEDLLFMHGHSLGAHVAGLTGFYMTQGKLEEIFALDPAGPLIEQFHTDERLDPSDARYVQVVHTDGGRLIDLEFGSLVPMGHVDHYPNGGNDQPYCHQLLPIISCDHFVAAGYANEAIRIGPNPEVGFLACPCFDWVPDTPIPDSCKTCQDEDKVLMGPFINKEARHGIYYLETNNNPPYAQG